MNMLTAANRRTTMGRTVVGMVARLAGMAVGLAPMTMGAGVVTPPAACAHETDQYTLPLNVQMADMGDYFDAVHYAALRTAVEKLNKETAAALADKDEARRDAELNRIRSPQHVMEAVFQNFDDAFTEIQDVEFALRGDWVEKAFPGQIAIWRPDQWIYAGTHFWVDPRQIVLQFDSSTVKAYGVYFGTDKLSHFHHMGRIYFQNYLERRAGGMSEEEAVRWIVSEYSTDSSISEAGLLGFLATGVYSNADLAADFSGFKFCRNLLEPVFLKGAVRPPMLVLKDEYFRLNKHVRPESGFFGAFISDHWNEALNPSWWEADIRGDVIATLDKRAKDIREFYTSIDGRPDDPEYYDKLAHDLSLMDGEDYGHCQRWDRLVTLAQVCWPEWSPQQSPGTAEEAEKSQQFSAASQGEATAVRAGPVRR